MSKKILWLSVLELICVNLYKVFVSQKSGEWKVKIKTKPRKISNCQKNITNGVKIIMIIVLFIKLISELLPSFKTQEVKVHRFLFHQRKESEITTETRKYMTDLQLVGFHLRDTPALYSCPCDDITYLHSYIMIEKAKSYRR